MLRALVASSIAIVLSSGLAPAQCGERWKGMAPVPGVDFRILRSAFWDPAPCNGSLGPLSLSALSLPWLGGTFASTASGFAPNALGASVLGFASPNTLLASITPFAAPGCLQLASTEATALALPQSGAAAYTFPIPNTPAYVGMVLFHQFLQLEPGSASQSPLLSSSNGLRLVFGTY